MRPSRFTAFLGLLWAAAALAACDFGGQLQSPAAAPTPDLQAVIAAVLAEASEPTITPYPSPATDHATTDQRVLAQAGTPDASALPTFTPRPVPTLRVGPGPTPKPPTFRPLATPTPRSPLADLRNGDRLERQDPTAANAVKTLPWIADGIDQTETAAAEALVSTASEYPRLFRDFISRLWVADGVDQLELSLIERFDDIASVAAPLAEHILALPWLADSVSQAELSVVQDLYYVAADDATSAELVINVPWIADGIEQTETAAAEELMYLASQHPRLFRDFISRLWVADGVDQLELSLIERFVGIADRDAALAERIAGLPWIVDGIEQPEPDAVDSLWAIATSDAELAGEITDLAWFADGVTHAEAEVARNFDYISRYDIALAASIANLPWVSDDLTDEERYVIDSLYWMARDDVATASRLVDKSWLADELGRDDTRVIENLGYVAHQDAALAQRIIGMPFLDMLEPPDVAAVDALASLAWHDLGALRDILAHPTVVDGITDEWAPIVATLYAVNEAAPAFVETLLDPDQVSLEMRSATLPHSGAVDLVIIRTGPGAERSMDLLEHSVRSVEGFMGEPLPLNYVGLFFGNAVLGYAGGTNYSTHMVALPEYDADDGGEAAGYASQLLAHEVAHYYWNHNRDWLDEGLSELMAAISENARAGVAVDLPDDYCADADHLALLDRLDAGGVIYDYGCNYALGGPFFLELYRALGDREFREGLRKLYLMSQVEDDADDYDGTRVGIRHIEEAFDIQAAGPVIARWYHGTSPGG